MPPKRKAKGRPKSSAPKRARRTKQTDPTIADGESHPSSRQVQDCAKNKEGRSNNGAATGESAEESADEGSMNKSSPSISDIVGNGSEATDSASASERIKALEGNLRGSSKEFDLEEIAKRREVYFEMLNEEVADPKEEAFDEAREIKLDARRENYREWEIQENAKMLEAWEEREKSRHKTRKRNKKRAQRRVEERIHRHDEDPTEGAWDLPDSDLDVSQDETVSGNEGDGPPEGEDCPDDELREACKLDHMDYAHAPDDPDYQPDFYPVGQTSINTI